MKLGMSDVMCGRFASIHATVRGRLGRVCCQMPYLLLGAMCVCEKKEDGMREVLRYHGTSRAIQLGVHTHHLYP